MIKKFQRKQISFLDSNHVPLDTKGTLVLPVIPERPMLVEYFKKKSLTDDIVAEHLTQVLDKFLRAIEAKDEQTIKDLTEPRFGQKLASSLYKTSNLTYSPPTGTGKAFVVDKLFIKGMNIDRTKNDTNFDYYLVQNMEKFGLRTFVHRFNTGDFYYYYMRDMK